MKKKLKAIVLALTAISAFAAESAFAASVTVQVAAGQESFGKVSGGKANAKAGSTLTLKATAAKGYGFAGWYEGEELVSWLSSWKYQVTDESKSFSARFVAAKDDGFALTDKAAEGYSFPLASQPKRSECLAIGYKVGVPHSEVTVKVSGLPSGVKVVYGVNPKFNGNFEFEGLAKKEGIYFVTFEAKNANGYIQSLTQMWVVGSPEWPYFDEIGIGSLGTMRVGEGCSRVWYSQMGYVQKFAASGLPPGLKFNPWSRDAFSESEFCSYIYGYPTKPGGYTIDFAKTYDDKTVEKSRFAVIVKDPGSFYVSVEVGDSSAGRGTASGSGVYRVGAKVPLSAKPVSKDYVFAGWFTDKSCTKPLVGGENHTSYNGDFTVSGEYRKASDTMVFYYDCIDKARSIYAKFLPKDSDYLSLSTDLGSGSRWDVDDMSVYSESHIGFEVDSGTLPTVTAKNLPPGFSLRNNRLIYADHTKVKPGMLYENVQLIAKNQTGKTDGKTFAIRTGNFKSSLAPNLKTAADAYGAMVGEDMRWVKWYKDLHLNDGYGDWKMSVSGLPPGVKANYDGPNREFMLSGMPTKPGVYTPVFTFTRGSGANKQAETFSFTITVSEQNPVLIGTFNGVTSWNAARTDIRPESRLVTITSANGGKVTAKVGNLSFSGSGWTYNSPGAWVAWLKTGNVKEGGKTWIYEMYAYWMDADDEDELVGMLYCWSVEDEEYVDLKGTDMYFLAKQNCYGKGYWIDDEVAKLASMMKTTGYNITGFYFAETEAGRKYSLSRTDGKNAAIKLAVDTKGVMKLSGTIDLAIYGGKKFKVSGSTTLLPGTDHSLTGWLPVDAGANGKCLFYFVYGGDNPDSAMFYKDAGN